MKKSFFFILLGIFLAVACVIYVPYSSEEGPPPGEEESYQRDYAEYPSKLDVSYFYDYLSGYGIWVYFPGYNYVWIPRATRYGWRPYTYGRWLWTDWGWTWVSNFEWGWAPFHYGRWGFDRNLGWFWMPGTVWSPAWVTWRRSELYIGWAPLPPQAKLVAGVGITSLPFSLPMNFWIFVEGRYFLDSYLDHYLLPFERNMTIVNQTIIRTNIVVSHQRVINKGIDVDFIRQVTKQKIAPYELRETREPKSSKIQLRRLEIYKPPMSKNQTAKPRKFVDKREARQALSKIIIRKRKKEIESESQKVKLEDVQLHELKLLEESQKDEVKELEKKFQEKEAEAKSVSEKEKVGKYYKKKIIELKKRHKTEKSEMEKRHKKEEKKVKKKKIKK